MSDNIIQVNKDLIHTELKNLVKNSIEETLNAMLDAEADKRVGPIYRLHMHGLSR